MERNLLEFLQRARQATWLSGQGRVETSEAGLEVYEYQDGPWFYRDSFRGGVAFLGNEVVLLNGMPLWGMNYHGRLLPFVNPSPGAKAVYAFLKEALRSSDKLYRGPERFSQDAMTYGMVLDWQDGTSFVGKEYIEVGKQPVYIGYFHGGMIAE